MRVLKNCKTPKWRHEPALVPCADEARRCAGFFAPVQGAFTGMHAPVPSAHRRAACSVMHSCLDGERPCHHKAILRATPKREIGRASCRERGEMWAGGAA